MYGLTRIFLVLSGGGRRVLIHVGRASRHSGSARITKVGIAFDNWSRSLEELVENVTRFLRLV